MKNAIWQYLTPSCTDQECLWKNCVFVFDTNILLNLYRYTTKTRDTLLSEISELKDRIWLPYQVAYEYSKNRAEIIYETQDKYEELDKISKDFINKIKTTLRLKENDKSLSELKSIVNDWQIKQKAKNLLVTQVSHDKILGKLLELFDGNVGAPFSEEELHELLKEGEKRYEKQIPPGYCDAKKRKENNDNNAYGDFIVWKEMLSFASEQHRDIIFITDDVKEDWCYQIRGRTVGPRPELRKEFFDITGRILYIYSMDVFLKQRSLYNDACKKVDQKIIDEVVDMREKQVQKLQQIDRQITVLRQQQYEQHELFQQHEAYQKKLSNINDRIVSLKKLVDKNYDILNSVPENYKDNFTSLDKLDQIEQIRNEHDKCLQELYHTIEEREKCISLLSEVDEEIYR